MDEDNISMTVLRKLRRTIYLIILSRALEISISIVQHEHLKNSK